MTESAFADGADETPGGCRRVALQPLTSDGREVSTKPPGRPTRRGSAPTRETRDFREEGGRSRNRFLGRGCLGRQEHATHEPLINSVIIADVRTCHWPGYPLTFRSDGDLPLDELVNQARDQALIRDTLLGRLPLDAGEVMIG